MKRKKPVFRSSFNETVFDILIFFFLQCFLCFYVFILFMSGTITYCDDDFKGRQQKIMPVI